MKGARVALAALSVISTACSAPSVEGDAGDTVFTSETGKLQVTVSSEPARLERGKNQIFYKIESVETGEPVDHLDLTLTPYMPAHGHASSTRPSAIDLSDGRYRFDDVVFPMPGLWELRTTVSGTQTDYLVPRFQIE